MQRCVALAVVAVAVVVFACRDTTEQSRTEPAREPAPIPAVHVRTDAQVADAAPTQTGASDVELSDEKQSVHLRSGRAWYGAEGFIVLLYTAGKGCEDFSPLEGAPGTHLQFELLPGPGGKFFAGQKLGTDVLVQSDVVPLMLSASQVELEIEPFETAKGQHVRGTIDGREHTLVGSAKVHGTFDVEICDGPDDPVPALRAIAPARSATGHLAGKSLVPRAALAMVSAYPASKDEAVDVAIKRKPRGSLDYVFAIAFYDRPNVPCPPPEETYGSDPAPIIFFQAPGGSSAARPILHEPQPVVGTSGMNSSEEQAWAAWITFDKLAFTHGARITGSLWAQPKFEWSPKGEFGGTFTAKVCVR